MALTDDAAHMAGVLAREALRPARAAERRVRATGEELALGALDAVLASSLTAGAVDRIVRSPLIERAVSGLMQGPLVDAIAAALIRDAVLERLSTEIVRAGVPQRVAEGLVAEGVVERSVGRLLVRPRARDGGHARARGPGRRAADRQARSTASAPRCWSASWPTARAWSGWSGA